MGIRQLSFRDLEHVIAIAECGTISRAADICAISQPALSERYTAHRKITGCYVV